MIRRKDKTLGFTLVEILIVLGIMGAIITLGLSRVKKRENNIKSMTRKLTVLSKEIRNQARLTFSTYRLVIDLDEKEPKYWVERAQGRVSRETEEQKKSRLDQEARLSDEEKNSQEEIFAIEPKFGKKPTTLPKGLHWGLVEIQGLKEPAKSGTEFIYYSPDGFVDQALLQITDRQKLNWTILFHPLTGQIDILPEAKTLSEIRP